MFCVAKLLLKGVQSTPAGGVWGGVIGRFSGEETTNAARSAASLEASSGRRSCFVKNQSIGNAIVYCL